MLLIFILLLLSLGYAWLHPPLKNWLVVSCLAFAGLLVSGAGPLFFTALLLIVFGLTTWVLFYAPETRKYYISSRLFAVFKKAVPSISTTEHEAISAGDIWWDAQLFSGFPDWKVLFEAEATGLSETEAAFVDGPLQELCQMSNDWTITHELNDLPESVWQFIREQNFFGLNASKKYGGLGFSASAQSRILQTLSSRSSSVAVTVMVPNSLGPSELLQQYGTDEQKQYYLPRLISGEDIPCFALTGPWAGSDADGMPDFGIACFEEFNGETVPGFRITWDKRYITLGPVATLLGLAFKAYDPERLLGDNVEPGITCALIPVDTPGVEIGERHLPLNMSFQNGPNSGDRVFIPMDWVIGGQEGVGQGWKMLMESLAAGRGISLPAAASGAAKLALRTTSAYTTVREQFGIEIGRFEGVQEVLARMTGLTYLLDSGAQLMTAALGAGLKPAIMSAIVKQQSTELSRTVINDAMDLHGGKGICMGPSNYLARLYQQIPVGITVEGANILTRSLIVFGQGALRCHPYLLEEMKTVVMEDENEALDRFDTVLTAHIAHVMENKMRSFGFGLTRGWLAKGVGKGPVLRYSRIIEHFSASFAYLADVTLLVLGGDLKRREMLSGRFADVLGNLYLASSAIKVFRDNGSSERERPVLEWACQYALFQAQDALDGILKNYPVRALGWALRLVVFPSGRYISMPADRLNKEVAERVQTSGPLRDRLTHEVFLSDDEGDIIYQLEQAFVLCEKTRDLRKRLKKSQRTAPGETYLHWLIRLKGDGVISENEFDLLQKTRECVTRVISVDSF
jgi:acyl-CoA dehydrogenase